MVSSAVISVAFIHISWIIVRCEASVFRSSPVFLILIQNLSFSHRIPGIKSEFPSNVTIPIRPKPSVPSIMFSVFQVFPL